MRSEENKGRKIRESKKQTEETRAENRPVDRREQGSQQKRAGAMPVDSGRVGQCEKMSHHSFVALWEFRLNTRSC